MHAYGAKNLDCQIKFYQIEYRPTESQFAKFNARQTLLLYAVY